MPAFDRDPSKGTIAILIDGEEFIRCDGDRYQGLALFGETLEEEPDAREVALFVWKPRHRLWLREALHMHGRA